MTLPDPGTLLSWLGAHAAILTALGALLTVGYYLVQLGRAVAALRREIAGLAQKVNAEVSGEIGFDAQRNRIRVGLDQLAQHNVHVRSDCSLRSRHHNGNELVDPYIAAAITLTNRGQEPVDLLACLVAGRELENRQTPGMGRQGREVDWSSLATSFWNDPTPKASDWSQVTHSRLFQGLSTTGSLFKVRSQLVRLDPREEEELLRIDAVTEPEALRDQGLVHLMYKVFVAVVSSDNGREALTNKQHSRWRSVQYTLNALNSLPFRLALDAEERQTGESLGARDPIGTLTWQNQWRCFLLHQWDFDQRPGRGPRGADDPYGQERESGRWRTANQIEDDIEEKFNAYDLSELTGNTLDDLRTYCRAELDIMVRAWRNLLKTIKHCDELTVGWKVLITEPYYQRRWHALIDEGYLFAHPSGDRRSNGEPLDPAIDTLAYERFAVRTKYLLCTVRAPDEPVNAGKQLGA